jgi:hypothetical protein
MPFSADLLRNKHRVVEVKTRFIAFHLSTASSLDRLPLFLVATATVVIVVIVVVFDVTCGDDETVCRRRLGWKSPFACDMSDFGKNFHVTSQIILKLSCRLWPLRSFYSIELGLNFPHCTAQHRLSVCMERHFVSKVTPVSQLHFPPVGVSTLLLQLRRRSSHCFNLTSFAVNLSLFSFVSLLCIELDVNL